MVHKKANDTVIANYTWQYDQFGQLVAEDDHADHFDYTYDDLGQLTGDGDNTWEFDKNGNRVEGGNMEGLDNRLPTDGTWDYEYDFEGNLTKKTLGVNDETWTYGWDNRNELIWVEKADNGDMELRVEFRYDVFGNRIEKKVLNDELEVDSLQRYALDGWNPAKPSPIGNENWDVLFDLDDSNDLVTRYFRGDVVDELFARIDGSTAYWTLTDHLGSIRDVISHSTSTTVLDTITYDPWGNFAENHPEYSGRYKWTGREFDAETGLQYNRGRYYDSATGRWLGQDPMGFDAGDSNLYRYVSNSPSNSNDPSGLSQQTADLSTGPQLGKNSKINQVGVTNAGEIIYGETGYVIGQLMYTGKCFTLANNKEVPVAAPSDTFKNLAGGKTAYNCAGCAFQTFVQHDLKFTQARLNKFGTKLAGEKADPAKGDNTIFYLWTFRIRVWETDKNGAKIGKGGLSEIDFHIVAKNIATSEIVSKDGPRPLDPRVAKDHNVFRPIPYIYAPSRKTVEAIENLTLQVYSGKIADFKKNP